VEDVSWQLITTTTTTTKPLSPKQVGVEVAKITFDWRRKMIGKGPRERG